MAISVTLSPYALTSLAMAKDQLNIPDANTDYDERVKRFINTATGILEKATGRKLLQRTGIVEYHSGHRNSSFLLNQWPALKPTSLWVDGSGDFSGDPLDASKYDLELGPSGAGIGVVSRCGLFPNGLRNIKVVYDGGFAVVPDDLQDACLWIMAYLYDMRQDARIGLAQKGKNQENTTYNLDYPVFVKNIIESYTRFEAPQGATGVYNG